MAEPFSIVGGVSATSNVLLRLIEHSLHYDEVPEEVKQFLLNIDFLTDSIQTSKRLRRTKSHLLDNQTKADVDRNIDRAGLILEDISRTIESCRKDLELSRGTSVGFRNRLKWVTRDHAAFMSRGMTLATCMQILSSDITRMTMLPGHGSGGNAPSSPPPYSTDSSIDIRTSSQMYGHNHTQSLPTARRQTGLRPPSMRRRRSQEQLMDETDDEKDQKIIPGRSSNDNSENIFELPASVSVLEDRKLHWNWSAPSFASDDYIIRDHEVEHSSWPNTLHQSTISTVSSTSTASTRSWEKRPRRNLHS